MAENDAITALTDKAHARMDPPHDPSPTPLAGNAIRSFGDQDAVLVAYDDPRCARVWNDCAAGFEQSFDGPTYLVIGGLAKDAALSRLASRFGKSLDDLVGFRAHVLGAGSLLTRH